VRDYIPHTLRPLHVSHLRLSMLRPTTIAIVTGGTRLLQDATTSLIGTATDGKTLIVDVWTLHRPRRSGTTGGRLGKSESGVLLSLLRARLLDHLTPSDH